MRIRVTVIVAAAMCAAGSVVAAERLNDAQLTQLIENIDHGFDRWKDDLERRNLDDAVLKSAAGTVEVRKFLEDMEDDIDHVKDRLKPDYAAGPEITALLRRASDVERRSVGQGGGSEAWRSLSGQLGALAEAYGMAWPADMSANAQRMTDRELADEAKRLADSADRLRNGALRAASDAKRPKPERDAADRQMRELKRAAQQLESGLKNHRAVSADAARVVDLSRQAVGFAQGVGPMKPEATSALTAVQSSTEAIAVAFRLGRS